MLLFTLKNRIPPCAQGIMSRHGLYTTFGITCYKGTKKHRQYKTNFNYFVLLGLYVTDTASFAME